MPSIQYTVTPANLNAHLFEVILRIDKPDTTSLSVKLPSWIPGSYMIRDFAKNIIRIEAFDSNGAVELERRDKQTWSSKKCSGFLQINYVIYAFDLSVRTAFLDASRAYFNGTSLFLQVEGYETQPCKLQICLPDSINHLGWQVATTLKPVEIDETGAGFYTAENYEELIDHPVEISRQEILSFYVNEKRHEIIFSGHNDPVNKDRITNDLSRICEQQHLLFNNGALDFDIYKFLVYVMPGGYGGLEHRSSTSLVCSDTDLLPVGEEENTEGYIRFLGLCSHEYFHSWNVKRIKPRVFCNPDLSSEVYTDQLWFFEGVTSYYDDLFLLRSGCISLEEYLELLAHTITRYRKSHGKNVQTVVESSFYAWTKFYKQDENAQNVLVSYYTKGALIALGLDITIRQATDNQKSLDDVMRYLWKIRGQSLQGIAENELASLICESVDIDLTDYFLMVLETADDLPLASWLDFIGIGIEYRSETKNEDNGRFVSAPENAKTKQAVLGIMVESVAQGMQVKRVSTESAAEKAGLAVGDVLMAIDRKSVAGSSLDDIETKFHPGDKVQIHFFRHQRLYELDCQLSSAPENIADLYLPDSSDRQQLENRKLWLSPLSGNSC